MQGIVLLVLSAFALPSSPSSAAATDDGPPNPVLLVWYQTNSVTDPKFMEKMRCISPAVNEAITRGAPLEGEQEAMPKTARALSLKEVEAISILLENNSKLLSRTWRAANQPPVTHFTCFTVQNDEY